MFAKDERRQSVYWTTEYKAEAKFVIEKTLFAPRKS